MTPTIQPGDFMFVDLRRPGHAALGDVVVFPYPADTTKDFVKRVFAMPGDLVEFRADGAYRNGRLVLRPPVFPHGSDEGIPFGTPGDPWRVPQGEVFLVGDNLTNSNDSRFWGALAESRITGRAYKIYWPPSRSGNVPAALGAAVP